MNTENGSADQGAVLNMRMGRADPWLECEHLVAVAETETGQLHGHYLVRQTEAMEVLGELFLHLPGNVARVEEFMGMAVRLVGMSLYRKPGLPEEQIWALLECLRLLPENEPFSLYIEAIIEFIRQANGEIVSDSMLNALAMQLEQVDRERDAPFACLLAGLLYCRMCNLLRAMECYESYICRHTGENSFFHQLFCLNISMSALYLGKYSMSYGIIESFRNTHELSGSNYLSLSWKRHLIFLLLRMGRLDEALAHLDQLLTIPQLAGKQAFGSMLHRALALYHYKSARPDRAIQILRLEAQELKGTGLRRSPFTDPDILEMLFEFRLHGEEHIPGYELEVELTRAEQGVSLLLRGVALRIRGQRLHEVGQAEQAVVAFEESLEALKRTGCVDAVLRSSIEYRLVLRELDRHGHEQHVHDTVQAYVATLVEQAMVAPGFEQPETDLDGVRRCLCMLDSMSVAGTLSERLSRLVGIVRRTLGAQRAVLFRNVPEGLEAVGTSNLTSVELDSAELRRVLEYLRLESGRASPAHPVLPCPEGRAMGLTVFIGRGTPWLLYLDNELYHHFFSNMSAQAGELLAAVLAAELRALLRGTEQNAETLPLPSGRRTQIPVFWGEGMTPVLQEAELIASAGSSVLIRGETGVGKERLARYIHERSGCLGAFVPVQLACLPEQLFESELFGHEKGAFTGAVRSKPGRAELANQGVLFLDEVGDMPLYFQIKLLRFLQERECTRVGGTQSIQTSFRLIAATHKDLREEVHQGRFREDLYYRLAVITLDIPPLRERRQDILPIGEHFRWYYTQLGAHPDGSGGSPLTREDENALLEYDWPGNIRELQNVMERAVALRTAPQIPRQDSRQVSALTKQQSNHHKDAGSSGFVSLRALLQTHPTLETLQDAYIQYILHETKGKIHGPHGALAVLGMKKTTFYSRIKERT